jgi:ABC-type multidrug transport system fused ATPase/permease subunit
MSPNSSFIYIYIRSPILCLDESTSSMDDENEKRVVQVVGKHFGSSTVISIAHRLDLVLDYDKVIVLDKGSVTLQHLLLMKGLFLRF